MQPPTVIPALAGLTLEVGILQGRDLIAKDRNLFGKRTTSDPYVLVYTVKAGSLKLLGRTQVVKKTCSPTWNETIRISMGADEATEFIQRQQTSSPTRKTLDLVLHIFDYDKVGDDDFMGMVEVKVDPRECIGSTTRRTTTNSSATTLADRKKWYPVGKGSTATHFCRNATGMIQVSITLVGRQMRDLKRGTIKHLQHSNITVGLAWDVEHGQRVDLDSSVVAINQYGNVSMGNTVYYGNLTNVNRSLIHSGDETTGYAEGDDERIQVQLDRIPRNILALYFLLTVATPGKTLEQVRSAQVRFLSTTTNEGICRIVPHKFGKNTALFLVRIARASGGWVLTPIEEGSEYAMDFGSLIPIIKAYTRDLIPKLRIDPTERIAIMRKGGTIRLTDYLPGNKLPPRVTFGLAWDVTHGRNIDLDASAILLDENYKQVDLVYFGQLTSNDGSVHHSGDEREGDEEGDDEKINIELGRVERSVKYIGFVVNSYSGEELDDVSRASCHLFDPTTERDIGKYSMTNASELDRHTALLVGCLYREEAPQHGVPSWHFSILSQPRQGKMAFQNVPDLVRLLKEKPPTSTVMQPPLDTDIDLSVMPTDLVSVDDEEIVVVPQEDLGSFLVAPPTTTAPQPAITAATSTHARPQDSVVVPSPPTRTAAVLPQATVIVQATPYRA